MTSSYNFDNPRLRLWKRWAIVWGVLLVIGVIVFLSMWNAFFEYVPAGKHLIIIAKDGDPLPPGHVLAEDGQKGIQREVLGEGWHFILPIAYGTELAENTLIPPGKVGIVTARGGAPLPSGELLADEGQQGIRRKVLVPGAYRLNHHGYDVAVVDAVEIKVGDVGVLRRKLGRDGKGQFAESPADKGILREVLHPGLYYIHTKEFEVIHAEVGIFQTTFRHDVPPRTDTAITFTGKGGANISMDCTVEWELLPADMPTIVAQYGKRQEVEQTVINLQARAIGRDKGTQYGAQDFLEGTLREKFQQEFTDELIRAAKEKKVLVHSAFIRRIEIPETYLKPIRERQIANETKQTTEAKSMTAKTQNEVAREEQMVIQRVAEVKAKTEQLVAVIDQEVDNLKSRTEKEIEKMRAEYQAKTAELERERTEVLGKAKADVTTLKETARGNLYQLKMDVFQNNGDAFLRYTLAEQINPKMVLRLFHSGPGTFWTNMKDKDMNLMLPVPTAAPTKPAPAEGGKRE